MTSLPIIGSSQADSFATFLGRDPSTPGSPAVIVLPPCEGDRLLTSLPHPVPSMAEQAEVVAFALHDPRTAILGRTLWMEFFPLSAWVKLVQPGPRFVMLRINPVFEIETGILAKDYVDHVDDEVWDESSTASFLEHDLAVLRTKRPVNGIETTNLPDGSSASWRVWKWPMFKRPGHTDDEVIAVLGFGEREHA